MTDNSNDDLTIDLDESEDESASDLANERFVKPHVRSIGFTPDEYEAQQERLRRRQERDAIDIKKHEMETRRARALEVLEKVCPPEHRNVRWSEIKNEPAENRNASDLLLEALDDWINDRIDSPFFLILGEGGLGKTRLAWAIAWELANQGKRCEFRRMTYNDFYSQVEPIAETRPYHMGVLKSKDTYLVIMDDLGAEGASPTERQVKVVEEIIRSRYDQGKKLLITTNLQKELLQNMLGERAYGTVTGSPSFTITGENKRKMKNLKNRSTS